MGEFKIDTEEGMSGIDYVLEPAELIGREKTEGRFGLNADTCTFGHEGSIQMTR